MRWVVLLFLVTCELLRDGTAAADGNTITPPYITSAAPSITTPTPTTSTAANSTVGVINLSTMIGVGCGMSVEYPTATNSTSLQPRFSQVINNSDASFISVHFKDFNLPQNDFIRIRALEGNETAVLEYHGNETIPGNYSTSLVTTSIVIELFTSTTDFAVPTNTSHCWGFTIDSYVYWGKISSTKESVCGVDETKEFACYANQVSDQKLSAVMRLLIHKVDGSYFCTGWLIGSEGHMITNNHCISTQSHANATEYEFMAQGGTCATSCNTQLGCPGVKPSVSPVLITTSTNLDYTLVKLDASLASQYGYLQMRETGAKLGEGIFITEHPNGWGKRLAILASGVYGTVEALDATGCNSTANQVAYSLDTQGGSSGSPVISWKDKAVVGLHHCGGCPNSAINTNDIIADMRSLGVLPADAVFVEETAMTQSSTPAPTTLSQTPQPTTLSVSTTPASTTVQPVTPVPTTIASTDSPTPSPTQSPSNQITSTIVNGTIFSTATTSSVDYIDFKVKSDAQVELDILSMEAVTVNGATSFTDVNGDCNAGYIDSMILLFQLGNDGSISESGLLATSDDALDGFGKDDGSISLADSYLSIFLTKGSYRLAVGPSPLTTQQAISKSTNVSTNVRVCDAKISNYGSYRLTISSTATITATSPNTYIGSQCSQANSVQPYSKCSYHVEAATSQVATTDGTIVRSSDSVSVDYIPFTISTFGRVTIEVSSYESKNGSDYVDVNGFCGSSYIDPVAFLFRANASGLTTGDLINAGDDDDNFAWRDNRHSVSFRDPYLSLALPPGNYILATGRHPTTLQDAIAKVSSQGVNLYTPESCGSLSNNGNYRVYFKSATSLSPTSPGTFSGSLCPGNIGSALCTA